MQQTKRARARSYREGEHLICRSSYDKLYLEITTQAAAATWWHRRVQPSPFSQYPQLGGRNRHCRAGGEMLSNSCVPLAR